MNQRTDLGFYGYAAACFSLHLQAYERGVALGTVEAVLCEDGQTVLLSAHDAEIRASFMLTEKTDEADFDHRKYVEGLNEDFEP